MILFINILICMVEDLGKDIIYMKEYLKTMLKVNI